MASKKVWYVVIERDSESGKPKDSTYLFFGPFTKKQAEWAIEEDPLIDLECQENCIDAWRVKHSEIDPVWLKDAEVCNPFPAWHIGYGYDDWITEAVYDNYRRVTELEDLLPKE